MSVATRRRARVRVRGHRAGCRLSALRPPAGRRAGARRVRAQRLPRRAARGRGLERRGRAVPGPARVRRRRRWRCSSASTVDDREPTGDDGFEIRPSPHGERADVPVTPDSATCDDCLRELLDPSDRRYRYPFINCTNCGPQVHDRPRRPLRPAVDDDGRLSDVRRAAAPSTRTRATGASTPSRTLALAAGRRCRCSMPTGRAVARLGDDAARAAAVDALRGGRIVAIKGIGGYHLACRADDEAAVGALRARKHREDKPFALMVASLARRRSAGGSRGG